LWLRDLRLGTEKLVMDPVEMDQSEESIPINGSYPMYRWTADGKSIVLHQGGKIRRLDVATGNVSTIPFTARVQRTISEKADVKYRIDDGPVGVRFIRWAVASPDGRSLAFQALGRLWVQALPAGTPRRLTPASFEQSEFQPAWSPDGRNIAFASVDAQNRGALWRVSATGGEPQRLTSDWGEYMNPAWTTDGSAIVAARGSGASARASTRSRSGWFDIVRIPAGGGEERDIVQVSASGGGYAELRPTVLEDGRIYWAQSKTFGEGDGVNPPPRGVEVVSVRPDGSDRKVHAKVKDADDAAMSPSGRWVAFMTGANTYLAAMPPGGTGDQVPMIAKQGGAFPATPLTTEGGLYPRWRTRDIVDFASGKRFFSYDAANRRGDTVTVTLSAPRALPAGSIALTGGRIVTLENKRV
ncbi:MAG TPA: hypothetical protein VFV33_04390, partial [Gemmatimonadaceae bacterium]|nr:hypothetical protein [Gemmatimonadaceae bacterium]